MGSRMMQAIFLPAMAIAFAAAPIAGQNFGAGHGARVRETFRTAILVGGALMLVLTLLCQLAARGVAARVHARSGGDRSRRAVPALRLVELRRHRA